MEINTDWLTSSMFPPLSVLAREPRQPGKGTRFSPSGISLGLGVAKSIYIAITLP
jgi:hypothetical protein